jgi:hypothetical protein
MAAGAAIVAGAIAAVSAIEAWFSLQGSSGQAGSYPQPPPESILGILLPLLFVACAIGLAWLARHLRAGQQRRHSLSTGLPNGKPGRTAPAANRAARELRQ